jgi:hypothetical protein
VTCPSHVTYEQFRALPPSFNRWIKNQRSDAMNSTWLQCRPQCTATAHRLKSVEYTYATELSTVHCYSILILAIYFRSNDPDRKAPNCSSVTCPISVRIFGRAPISAPILDFPWDSIVTSPFIDRYGLPAR